MFKNVLLAVPLQHWERYSRHALACRDIAAVLNRRMHAHLYVVSVYNYLYETLTALDLPPSLTLQYRSMQKCHTDQTMQQRLQDFVAPLAAQGMHVTTLLRVGNPGRQIVRVLARIHADLLILGAHNKRGVWDVAPGGTAQQIMKQAPCRILLVSPTP